MALRLINILRENGIYLVVRGLSSGLEVEIEIEYCIFRSQVILLVATNFYIHRWREAELKATKPLEVAETRLMV